MIIPATGRWTSARKRELLDEIRRGEMSIEQACEEADLSIEELVSWQKLDQAHGRAGLRATRLQTYRG